MTLLYDVTLRDGNHALRHTLTSEFVSQYCKVADSSGVWAVEVGHGNGLGASSFLVGKSSESDEELLSLARSHLKSAKLAVHTIPGFATADRDLIPAIDIGVEVFRVATHVTEASVAEKHIEFLATRNLIVHGVLMMSHMIDIEGLVAQATLMKKFGASAIILMDSAGHFVPDEVRVRVDAVRERVAIEVGFHAHNNLGVAVSNAESAIVSGANIIDGASMGLGAGAGNAQLENIVATSIKVGKPLSPVSHFLEMSRLVETTYPGNLPRTNSSSIESGLAGVFSGYAPQVKQLSEEMGIEVSVLWQEMGKRKLVAGQESMIREIAQDLMNL
ncbi:MAG: 4-hydroxy-2-oxovalerate aldolase [Actinomycetota bacterium]